MSKLILDSKLIAPCGIYCGACYMFLREKKRCLGCRVDSTEKPKYCEKCKIAHCERLLQTPSGFCFDCATFPCQRLKQLDKRYSTKYGTGLIQNQIEIKEKGTNAFLTQESAIRTCSNCGSVISIHWKGCIKCNNNSH